MKNQPTIFMPNLTRYKAARKPGYLLLAILITTNIIAFQLGGIL
tara:strand:- start:282 stop:413 length:132 start_codon:yes stop_codon:yes gene_type:complete